MDLVHGGTNAASQHQITRLKTVGPALGLAALSVLPLAAYLVGTRDGAQSSPARAAPVLRAQQHSGMRIVRYIDFDTPRGSRAAYVHLRAAVRRVCEQMQDGNGIGSRTPYSMCVDEALRETLGTSALPEGLVGPSE